MKADTQQHVFYLGQPDLQSFHLLQHQLETRHVSVTLFQKADELLTKLKTGDRPVSLIIELSSNAEHASWQHLSQFSELLNETAPIIVVLENDKLDLRLAAYGQGALRCLINPSRERLTEVTVDCLSIKPENPFKVLFFHQGDKRDLECIANLKQSDLQVIDVQKGDVISLTNQHTPDVILFGLSFPMNLGLPYAALIHDETEYNNLPTFFLYQLKPITRGHLSQNFDKLFFLHQPSLSPIQLSSKLRASAHHYRKLQSQFRFLQDQLRERHLEHLAVNEHAIVSSTNVRGDILYVNDKFCEISGYERDDLIGKNHRILKSNVHDDSFYKKLWQTISNGNPWHGKICNQKKDGSLYWVSATIVPFLDQHGKPYQYVSVRTDITNLHLSEQRYRHGQTFANTGTWDWNIQTGELYWSDQIAPLFGYSEGNLETTYDNFLTAVHPDDRQSVIDAVNQCIEQGKEYKIEHRCIWPNGEVRWLLEQGDVVRTTDGRPLHMLGTVQDITDQKLSESQLNLSSQRLVEAQKLAQIGNWEANLVTGELYWSRVIYNIFGQDPETFQPNIEHFFECIHPDDRSFVESRQQQAMDTGSLNIVHRIVRPNGFIRYVQELGRVERDQHGTPIKIVGTVQDVTSLKEAEQAMTEAKEQAEKANLAKSQFLSNMSHELRTPMNAILGFAQLLEHNGELTDDQTESLHEIIKAGKHLLQLINEVLDLSRIESGNLEITIEPISLKSVMNESIILIQSLAMKNSVTLHYQDNCDYQVQADRLRIKQVLLNLLSNAVKYNRPDGDVFIDCKANRSVLKLSVRDTGAGLSKDDLKQLFKPFTRFGKNPTAIEGTGIGLTISQQLMKHMSGTLYAESTLDQGSTFWLEIPLSQVATQAIVPDTPQASDDLKVLRGNRTVLYIDDNPVNLKLVEKLLKDSDHNIRLIQAEQSRNGIALAKQYQPDLILLDIRMPEVDGYEILEQFKTEPLLADTPVIALSAQASKEDIEHALQQGFCCYLTKPLDVTTFYTQLDHYLNDGSDSLG